MTTINVTATGAGEPIFIARTQIVDVSRVVSYHFYLARPKAAACMSISFLFRNYGATARTLRHAPIFHPLQHPQVLFFADTVYTH